MLLTANKLKQTTMRRVFFIKNTNGHSKYSTNAAIIMAFFAKNNSNNKIMLNNNNNTTRIHKSFFPPPPLLNQIVNCKHQMS